MIEYTLYVVLEYLFEFSVSKFLSATDIRELVRGELCTSNTHIKMNTTPAIP